MFAYLTDRKFLHATALLVGSMVGVGIFGIPFAFAQAGFWVGVIWLVVLALVTMVFDLAFAELTLRTQGIHQITGYASIWLGPWARRVSFFAVILSGYGTLLAYMIIVGQFLHNILSHYIAINPDWYSIIFAIVWSLVSLVRLRTVAAVDLFMSVLFGVTVAVITAAGLRHIDWNHFVGWTSLYWFLPYGVMMFAFSGANAIPLQRQLLTGRERLLKPAIITAVVVVALLYLVFASTVVGVSGGLTTPDAVAGLYGLLGGGVILLSSLFGIMTISTSFLMMSTALYETFRIDYGMKIVVAWLLVIVPPLLFFWTGLRNFIDVIGLVGSVAVGLLSIIVLAAYRKARTLPGREPEFTLSLSRLAMRALMFFFVAGVVYSLVFR